MKLVGDIIIKQHWAYQKIDDDIDFAGVLVAISEDANKENLAEEFKDVRFPIQKDKSLLIDKTLIEEDPFRQFGWTWINQETGEMSLNRFDSHRLRPYPEMRVIGSQILEEVSKKKAVDVEQTFADAVANIPTTETQMEQ